VYSEEGFADVADFVSIARGLGLRIIFSGPNTLEGVPSHRRGDSYADPAVMDACCDLWRKLGERFGGEPAIMAWDLLNEPHVGWPNDAAKFPHRLSAWRAHARDNFGLEVGEDFPAMDSTGQDRGVYRAYVDFVEHLAGNWVARQAEALRSSGAKQNVTVGLVQWSVPIFLTPGTGYTGFRPRRIAPHLDYMSAHFYPILSAPGAELEPELPEQVAYLEVIARATRVEGKPLVMEEFGWKGGRRVPGDPKAWPEEHQSLWCERLMDVTGCIACGWLNWAWRDCDNPKTDISAASGLWTHDGRLKDWGGRFLDFARRWGGEPPPDAPAQKRYEMDLADYMYDNGGHPPVVWLRDFAAREPETSLEVVFG